ncbi:hypothetical protein PACTADRAFT_375 [Pachysolen tannophilus NRRL Y-2460]|uniref:Signal recognition particle subunit SRP14 n=1 Tax=Pachysolen tannophilus NRRL Y-2460 TaxID=669874 RepID=A0A1E4U1K2_PACTA|nr:hypothetical protein PACTADRAFT_375 [Pachysolen tannophilus NRRL Y-2460]
MTLLENDQFLRSVSDLLVKTNGDSSVYLTQKRLSPETKQEVETPLLMINVQQPTSESTYPIIIRITNGSKDKATKVKYSTVVEANKLDEFWENYTNALKNGMIGLKKKDKKKKNKNKNKKKILKN